MPATVSWSKINEGGDHRIGGGGEAMHSVRLLNHRRLSEIVPVFVHEVLIISQ